MSITYHINKTNKITLFIRDRTDVSDATDSIRRSSVVRWNHREKRVRIRAATET